MNMRQPTQTSDLYAWYKAALEHKTDSTMYAPAIPQEPQCGWYQRKLVRGGPWVPAVIWMDQPIDVNSGELEAPEQLFCQVGDAIADADEQWPWLCTEPIREDRWKFMQSVREWTFHYAPHEPENSPLKPYNWNTLKPDF